MSRIFNPEIFREYDIRGVAERDLTSSSVEVLGRAFAEYLRTKDIKSATVGYDARLSSPRLRDSLCRGLTEAEITVTDIGLCPTPALYFSLFQMNPGAGIMITGSHNPPEFNGFKLCVAKDTIYGEEIQKIKKIAEEIAKTARSSWITGREAKDDELRAASYEHKLTRHPILPDYISHLKHAFPHYRNVPLKVVIDGGNGTAGLAAPEIIRSMGCEVIELFSEPDGSFPNHHPDPTIPENLEVLIKTVGRNKADFGIAFDGDADRIGVVDEEGSILWGDHLMVIFAREILKERPGATIVSEVKCSQVMYDDIRTHGGNAIMWKAGHSLIKAKMKETGAIFGGEMSGHLFFADRYFGYDDAIYAACRLVEILKKLKSHDTNTKLRSLLADLPKTFNTPEIRIDCPDNIKFAVVDRIKEVFMGRSDIPIQPKEVITVDGIRAIFDNGWGLIRASNTQPVLVMRFEASDSSTLEAIKTTMEKKVKEVIVDIQHRD
ncbi:MAG TPA: phosphomannomutase [Nitrospiraceae bacterium]|nr:phosphomannomutase [Nitrospiraceae bacterium]